MEFRDVVMKRRAVRRFEDGGVEPRGHRADRAARPADALGRVQPGPAAGRRDGPRAARGRAKSAARTSTGPRMGPWVSECAAQFVPCVSEEVYHRRYREPDKVLAGRQRDRLASPVLVGRRRRHDAEHHACGGRRKARVRVHRAGRGSAAVLARHPRGVHADRRHAGGPAAPRCPVAEPQARLGAVRAVRPLGSLGLKRPIVSRGRRPRRGVRVPAGRSGRGPRPRRRRTADAGPAAGSDAGSAAKRASSPRASGGSPRTTVQRSNGQPRSRQNLSSECFANTTSRTRRRTGLTRRRR